MLVLLVWTKTPYSMMSRWKSSRGKRLASVDEQEGTRRNPFTTGIQPANQIPSGKSSLLLSLLGLLETKSGTRHIDGMDLALVPRDTVRSRLATLPQDPVKLQGTVRTNLDPEGRIEGDDDAIIMALTKAKIWEAIDARGGLDADFGEVRPLAHDPRNGGYLIHHSRPATVRVVRARRIHDESSDADLILYDMNAYAEENMRFPLDVELEFAGGEGI